MIPNKVKIGGINYQVCRDKDSELNCGNLDGEIRYSQQEIVLNSKMNGEYAECIFIHEVVHGICNTIGRNDLRVDERFIESFSQCLYQVLKDNKLSFDQRSDQDV